MTSWVQAAAAQISRFLPAQEVIFVISSDGSRVRIGGSRLSGRFWDIGIARFLMSPGVPDRDADGLEDGSDNCPRSFGTRDGCPTFGRDVRLIYDSPKRRFLVTITPDESPGSVLNCDLVGRVKVFERQPGRDSFIGAVPADPPIRLEALAEAGTYYAVIPRKDTNHGRCKGARSNAIKLN